MAVNNQSLTGKIETTYTTYLMARSTNDMEVQLAQIKVPFQIVGVYGMNSRHYVVIQTSRPLIKKQIK